MKLYAAMLVLAVILAAAWSGSQVAEGFQHLMQQVGA